MNPRLKVTCPDCGHVRLEAGEVRLVVAQPPRSPYYVFSCPGCARRVRRPVTVAVAAAMLARRVPGVRALRGG